MKIKKAIQDRWIKGVTFNILELTQMPTNHTVSCGSKGLQPFVIFTLQPPVVLTALTVLRNSWPRQGVLWTENQFGARHD